MSQLGRNSFRARRNASSLLSSPSVSSDLPSNTSSDRDSLMAQPPSPRSLPRTPSLYFLQRDSQPSDSEVSTQMHLDNVYEPINTQDQDSQQVEEEVPQPPALPRTREGMVALRNILRAVRDIESPSGGETDPPGILEFNDALLILEAICSHVRPMTPLNRAIWFYESIEYLTGELDKLVKVM